MASPAGQEYPAHSDPPDELGRVLSFPLAGVPADQQAHRDLEAGLCIPEGGDEGVQSLCGGEPAYVDQDAARGELRDLVGVSPGRHAWLDRTDSFYFI